MGQKNKQARNESAKPVSRVGEEIKDSETRYRRLFETAQDGILILDGNTGKITDVNPFLLKMLGYSHEELLGKKLWEIGSFSDIKASQFAFDELQKKKYIRYEDLPLRTRNGRRREVEFISNVYTVGDKLVIQCNIRDVTKRKRVEEALEKYRNELESMVQKRTAELAKANEALQTDITARKQADEAQQQSEKRFRTLIENGADVISLINADGTVLYDSPSYQRMLGYGAEERVGQNTFELVHPDDREGLLSLFAGILQKPGLVNLPPTRIRHADGSWHWIEGVANNLLAEPSIQAIVVNFRDITERKQAEQVLRESEDKFKHVFEYSNVGKSITLASGEINVNRAFCEMLGYAEDELKGKKWQEITHPDDIESTQREVDSIISGGKEATRFTKRYLRKDGSIMWADVSSSVRRDEQGKTLYLMTSILDITERMQAEEKQQYQASLLKNVNDAIVASDAQFRLTAWNTAAESVYGWKAEEVIGKYGLDITQTQYPETDQSKMLEDIAKTGFYRGEATQVRKDGRRFPVEISSVVLRDSNNQISGYVSVNRDISERKKAEESLRESEERFTKAFRSIPDALVISRLEDGKIIEANESWRKVFGYSREEVIGKSSLDLNLFADPVDRQRAIAVLREQGFVRDFELQIRQKSGTVRTAILSIELLEIQDEQYMLTVVQDITERKQVEEKLRASEEQFRLLVEGVKDYAIFMLDPQGNVTSWNKGAEIMKGYRAEEIIGQHFSRFYPEEDIRAGVPELLLKTSAAQGRVESEGWRVRKDGTRFSADVVITPISDEKHQLRGFVKITRDITERKRAEEAVRNSEKRFRALIENSLDEVSIIAADGSLIYESPSVNPTLGYEAGEFLGQSLFQLVCPDDLERVQRTLTKLLQDNSFHPREQFRLRHRDGTWRWVEAVGTNLLAEPSVGGIVLNYHDITERKMAEEALAAERNLLSTLIDNLPDNIFIKNSDGRIVMDNSAHRRLLGVTTQEETMGKTDFDFFPQELAASYYADEQEIIRLGEALINREELTVNPDGEQRWLLTTKVPLRDHQGMITGIVGINRDITERKMAEEALVAERSLLRTLVEILPDPIYVKDATGRKTLANPVDLLDMGAASEAEVLGKTDFEFFPSDLATAYAADDQRVLQSGESILNREEQITLPGGALGWQLTSKVPLRDSAGRVVGLVGVGHDITERKRVEQALAEFEKRFRWLYEYAPSAYHIITPDGVITDVNHKWCELLGYRKEAAVGKSLFDFMVEQERESAKTSFETKKRSKQAFTEGGERGFITKDGAVKTFKIYDSLSMDESGEVSSIQTTIEDITERKQAETQIQRQLERLAALHAIDIAIAGSTDLNLTLDIILEHVVRQLSMDAADVLLLNPYSQTLEYAAGLGFRTAALQQTQLRLGQGYAGLAGKERKTIHVSNLRGHKTDFLRSPYFKSEGFDTYYCVPLIAKGKLKGVLETFQRAAREQDSEWLDFLNTLAGQAAIAIDNVTLFNDLQRTNDNLLTAYDITIEGWSKALDLRDKETEGHTLRVTEMTLNLAHSMGLKDADLANIRRGALLHDIGKMGIPDGILLKPGPLTDEEWVMMKKHPALAYELLSPINYLRPALDIPYCHHEKWDGTGYPRGLKGEQIPLGARIFAVVDVWDALTSDRPYRKAWSKEKALEHIRAGAGTHFDPKVVDMFLNLPSQGT